ncbi:MAG: hypothetical protein KJ667_07550, partial [Alphaproteobacteria bacterium]|nr:hypothetical protein [Alphaproteobacteria bacterium]
MTTTTTTETDSIKQHLATMGVTDAATRDKVLGIGLSWPYYVRLLDETHIPAMLALQEAGGDGQILDRDAQTLTAHFNAGQTAMGVFHQGELVAQSLITTGLAAPG